MRKIAFAAAVLVTAGWALLSWSDNSAQDAADYATRYGNCKAADR
jgi:hypothetical protein